MDKQAYERVVGYVLEKQAAIPQLLLKGLSHLWKDPKDHSVEDGFARAAVGGGITGGTGYGISKALGGKPNTNALIGLITGADGAASTAFIPVLQQKLSEGIKPSA